MAFKFSKRSKQNLNDVHPLLVKVVYRALEISKVDFTVVDGLRSLEKQREYVAKGVSRTMKSYHLRQSTGYSHAVDLYPYYDGSVQVEAPCEKFCAIALVMKQAAAELGVTICWGGDWKRFIDRPHYQIEVD